MFPSQRFATLLTVLLFGTAACATDAASADPSASSPVASISTPLAATTAPTPAAVRDGESWLAYSWPRVDDGVWSIRVMRPDGTDAHEVAAEVPGEHKFPVWSPDGSTLAFVVRNDEHPEGSIWTVRADGSGAALLSAGGTECPVGLFHPAWSADGTKLAVVCYPGGGDHESIAILDLETGSIRRLADFTYPEVLDAPPTWSPDGTSIAFTIQHWDPAGTALDWTVVATVPAAGGAVRRLTEPEAFMTHPDWRPDGTELVMNSYDLGNIASTPNASNLYAIKPDGSGLRQITHSSVDGSMRIGTPTWDPDGSRIAVSVLTSTGPAFDFADVHLAFVDAVGGEPVLISGTVSGKNPDVRPTP